MKILFRFPRRLVRWTSLCVGGGFVRGGAADRNNVPGTWEKNPNNGEWAISIISGNSFRDGDSPGFRRAVTDDLDAQVVLHELIHFAAFGRFYSDSELATAAADIMHRKDAPKLADYPGEKSKLFGHDTSAYFDNRLREKCPSLGVHYSGK